MWAFIFSRFFPCKKTWETILLIAILDETHVLRVHRNFYGFFMLKNALFGSVFGFTISWMQYRENYRFRIQICETTLNVSVQYEQIEICTRYRKLIFIILQFRSDFHAICIFFSMFRFMVQEKTRYATVDMSTPLSHINYLLCEDYSVAKRDRWSLLGNANESQIRINTKLSGCVFIFLQAFFCFKFPILVTCVWMYDKTLNHINCS